MKKFFVIIFSGLVTVFLSCNDTTTSTTEKSLSTRAQKNLDAHHSISKAFEAGDASIVDSVTAVDFVDHTDRGDMNRDSLKKMITEVRKHFPDMKTEVIKEFADDDYVVSLERYTGTS